MRSRNTELTKLICNQQEAYLNFGKHIDNLSRFTSFLSLPSGGCRDISLDPSTETLLESSSRCDLAWLKCVAK